ncbi:type I-E CRISPR-associated protein Cse2/CasB [Synechococcus sp. W55.1]|uniref:type I-E CRISPR-associated protein Cse2/CasB n=1 Tax=Synechococcus sp. W55.1 TaxID=2964512 RepID=UPI0039C47D4A
MTRVQTLSHNRLERATRFLQAIQERVKNDNGTRAAFKRALSGEAYHLWKVYPFVLPYLEGIPEWQQDIWIFVACLSVYHDQDVEPDPSNFAKSCRELQDSAEPSKGPEKRFKSLLEAELDYIQYPITALVRQMKSKSDRKIFVHYPTLIADLCLWNHPNQIVQDRWARTFWQISSSESEGKKEVDDATSEAIDEVETDM